MPQQILKKSPPRVQDMNESQLKSAQRMENNGHIDIIEDDEDLGQRHDTNLMNENLQDYVPTSPFLDKEDVGMRDDGDDDDDDDFNDE